MMKDSIPIERQRKIIQMVDSNGIVRIDDLCTEFDVSLMTIRRDLIELENRGHLTRAHGGAVSKNLVRNETLFDQKDKLMRLEKTAIAKAAHLFIEPGDTIFVNSGTTTLEFLQNLPDMNLRIVTSNARAISTLIDTTKELIILGGVYRQESRSIVGGLALEMLSRINGGKCFIGVDGLHLKAGLTTPHHSEAEIARKMIDQTNGTVIVVADSSKLGGVATFSTCSIDLVDVVITDSGISDTFKHSLLEREIRVVVAP